ncbi:UDP-Glycosyltransferase/glycogen phosphorylase [Jaminaea rosea]|uniref:GDP-Man:Man(3)GlcNAc(2)-PP-Dol alpha-1,2-mannosyltransferase n=1 Tax=Jaminaea rosea TaxID=1569628 RepID=A0A316UNQ7_9BASI|nr:UDP-Glycosyltransferase/glycogen phosphorylase [Jaminaea rosea]PWN25991.1 UDP-Glycosyltransferase/glycogen phosphorylase [Jaminaea rosea]
MEARHSPPPWHIRIGVTLCLLILSLTLLTLRALTSYLRRVRKTNSTRRQRLLKQLNLPAENAAARQTVIGFFHPYCNAGGGGERVLYEAIRYHLAADKHTVCVVYTGDATAGGSATKSEILIKARDRFSIDLTSPHSSSRLAFLPLRSRLLVSDSYWSRLTILGQSFGGAILAKEACEELLPDVFIDTMGYAFAYPVVRLFRPSTPVGAYVHYPTVSADMLARVKGRATGHTNDAKVAKSMLRSQIKLVYYRLFAKVYAWALRRADVLVANGTWTMRHLNTLLGGHGRSATTVYPPCDTRSLEGFPLSGRKPTLVSLAQFRPEKEQATQLRLLRALFDLRPSLRDDGVRLIVMGSSRNPSDEARVASLRRLASELDIASQVEFVVNAPWPTVVSHLSTASVGLSTMVDEHFGMNVVEFMAAGLITLSHASAGPLLDIVVPDEKGRATGFHATDVDDFAKKAQHVLCRMSEGERDEMRGRARRRAQQVFNATAFEEAWRGRLWEPLEGKLKALRDRDVKKKQ